MKKSPPRREKTVERGQRRGEQRKIENERGRMQRAKRKDSRKIEKETRRGRERERETESTRENIEAEEERQSLQPGLKKERGDPSIAGWKSEREGGRKRGSERGDNERGSYL